MEKRGFLLAEETLKIILAVIAIGFLAYLLFSIYSARKESKELELAKASLDFLIEEINSDKTEIEIYNPSSTALKKWWIASWPYNNIMPKSCSNVGWENCICIFSGRSIKPEGYAEDSDNHGVCREVSKRVIVSSVEGKQSPVEIADPPLRLNANYGEEITITKK